MSKLKVAVMSYVIDNRSAKGSAVYARRLIEGLTADPNTDLYLVHYYKNEDEIYQRATEVLMPVWSWLPVGGQFLGQLRFFWRQRQVPFDIIHWCQPRLYPLFWLAPAHKIVLTAHGGGDVTAVQNWSWARFIFIWVIRLFHHKIDVVIADSEAARLEINHAYGIPLSKVKAVPIGGGEDYKPIPAILAQDFLRQNYNLDKPFILDVARLQPHKNINRVILAYNKFRQSSGLDVDLVIIGKSTSEAKITYKLAKDSPYASFIHFIDYVSEKDLNYFYSACLVFLFPSLNEGFGLPVVEAMAAGAPVITSNITSLPEVAADAAYLVDPYNVDDIAVAIEHVASREDMRASLSGKGLQRAKNFTWPKTVEQTMAIYKSALSS